LDVEVYTSVRRVPNPTIEVIEVGAGTVRVGWREQQFPVTLWHSPSVGEPVWAPLAEGLRESGWHGPLPSGGEGFLRVMEP